MQLMKIGVVLCVGLGAVVACDSDEGDGLLLGPGASGGSAGSGGSSAASGAGKGGKAANGGSTADAGSAGTSAGSAGKGGTEPAGDAGAAGEGGTANGGSSGGAGDGGVAGSGEGGAGNEAGSGGSSEAGFGGEGGDGGTPGPLGQHCIGCTLTKIGSPLWQPTGAIALAGDVGSTTPDLFIDFTSDLVEPNHAYDANDNIIGPAVAHAGPYHDEVYTLALAGGETPKQAFTAAEFTAPNGVVIMLNIVPTAGAPTGSSFDFASGPIMPNAIFPLAVDGDVFREGVMYDQYFDSSFPGYSGLTPPIVKDGASHLLWFFGEDNFFGPANTPTTGAYEFRLKITDSNNAGWNLTMPFTVY